MLLQEGGPLPGPRGVSCLILGNELCETYADKARDFVGKECPDGEKQDSRTQENYSAMWLVGFMMMGLVSGCLQPIILTQGPSCGAGNAQARDPIKEDCGRWEEIWRLLSQILPVGGGLSVPCSLAGPPITK